MGREVIIKDNIRPHPPQQRSKYLRTLKTILKTAFKLPIASAQTAIELLGSSSIDYRNSNNYTDSEMLRKKSSAMSLGGVSTAGVAGTPSPIGLSKNSGKHSNSNVDRGGRKEVGVIDYDDETESTLVGEEGDKFMSKDDGDADDAAESGEDLGYLRWGILAMSCLLMFGNFYAYDLPAALNKPLQGYLGEEGNTYQYQLNLFYSLYSLPNIILPFFGGFLLDTFGTRKMMTVLSALVCLGQILFSIGVSSKKYWIMHLGRVIFGVGGESLSVAQTRITSKWFKGKEIAFALGVNLSVARLGSVMNDFVSPHLAVTESVPVAIWFGTITCIISFCSGVCLNALDAYGSSKMTRQRSIPLKKVSRSGETPRRKANLEPKESEEKEPGIDLGAIFKFHLAFWQICFVMCLMFATVIPFNTIHSALLQSKWYPGDPQTAGQIMAVPDVISAVLVPFCGTFVDRYGKRVKILILCGSLMGLVHFIFGFATPETVPSPLPTLWILGFSYAMLLTFWPCIPLVVDEKNLATAFGAATALQNSALVVFPIIVAALVNADKTFFMTEMFFVLCCLTGVSVCIWMYWVDKTQLGGVLERGCQDPLPSGKSKDNIVYTSLRDDILMMAQTQKQLGCFPSQEILQMFQEGMKMVFARWTALQIAIENQMAGTSTSIMASTLEVHTVDFFRQYGVNVEVDELEGNLEGYMEECFNLGLEDGSPGQVARAVTSLFRELAAEGRSDVLDRLRASAKSVRPVTGIKPVAADSDYEDSEDDDSDMDDEDVGMEQDAAPAPPPPAKPEKIVDEDGFEMVQKGRRRR
ncbi:hypothetical protein HDU67_002214 [Dinochytrium kinnereticum]|nr:hypothetical protein HDU67_002214 [Dinochytrium kinnereticum]